MKRIGFFLVLFSSYLSGCNLNNELTLVSSSIKEVSKENDCLLSFEIEKKGEISLIVNFECDNETGVIQGKILYELFMKLESKKISYDYYIVQDNGDEVLKMSYQEIEQVIERKANFEKNLQLLISRKYEDFYNLFNSKIKSLYSYEELTLNFDSLLTNNYLFAGFNVSEFDGDKYVIFKSVDENKYVILSYKLIDSDKNELYGIELI